MQQFLSRFRLQTKLLASFSILFCILFLASSMIRARLVNIRDEVDTMVNDHRPVEQLTMQLDARLDDTLASLGLFVSVRSQAYADHYRQDLAEVYDIADRLQSNPLVAKSAPLADSLRGIRQNIDKLSVYGDELIGLAASDEANYPGLAYANQSINPLIREILQALSQMTHAEQPAASEDARQLLLLKADLRYYWVKIESGVRAYLAYRSKSVVQDNALYLDAARQALDKIAARGKALSIEDEEALPKIRAATVRFESRWKRLQEIHTSDNWRSDSHLMRTRIGPLYEHIEEGLQRLSETQREVTDTLAGSLVSDSRHITWLTGAFLIAGVLVGLFISLGISRLFTRPLLQVSGAMQQIASGDADLSQHLDADGRDEIAVLARSFNTFVDKAQQSAEEERVLSQLLRLSLNPSDLPTYLDQALKQMIGTVTWLALQPKGGILLTDADDDHVLKLVATHNFDPALQKLCATVTYGSCLCGRAAASGEVVFANCVDGRHEISHEGILPHGHYNVPIKSGTSVLGVLVLYLPMGHVQSEAEVRFLKKIAEVLSMGISLRQAHTDLVAAKREAESVSDQLTGITGNLPGIIFQCRGSMEGECEFTFVSPGTSSLLGTVEDDPKRDIRRLLSDVPQQDRDHLMQALGEASQQLQPINVEYRVMQQDGGTCWVLCNALPRRIADGSVLWDGLLLDITLRKNLESQLLQAQKLESVGQLAAGIAHEINTPTQYVQDNTRFLQEAFASYYLAFSTLRKLRDRLAEADLDKQLLEDTDRILESLDIDYLTEDIPVAIEQSLEGLRRIATIVAAMKEFTHPGTDAKQPVDVNAVIDNIVTVSRNEWKYVAELETDLQESLPAPPGYRDKLGQVILNLIVNAAHAIGDEVEAGHLKKGHIRVTTATHDDAVEIRISDDGPGIPEAIQQKIFDPFFTTKEVGKGTGQGLSIARSVVVDQHQGSLTLDSTPGDGATFTIHLPLHEVQDGDAIAA
ncbi:MAG: ATP-binding protein [Candidatus Thiodiazotropha sp.]